MIEQGVIKASLGLCRDYLSDPEIALVSDLDHTLLDTSIPHRESFTQAVQTQLGRTFELTPEFVVANIRGRSGPEIIRVLHHNFGDGYDDALIAEGLTLRNKVLVDLAGKGTVPLIPGVETLVRQLRGHNRISGIATQSPDLFAQRLLEQAVVDNRPLVDVFPANAIVGETSLVQALSSAQNGTTLEDIAKPNPFSIKLAAQRALYRGTSPILYIGDSPIDGQSVAGKSGFVGILVNKAKRAELANQFAGSPNIIVLESLEELAA